MVRRASKESTGTETGSKASTGGDSDDEDIGFLWMEEHDNLIRAQSGKVQRIVKTMRPGDHAGELSLLF